MPKAMMTETAMHVQLPKLRFPASENAWLVIFRSLVHRITSQGAGGTSDPAGAAPSMVPDMEDCRECMPRKAGEPALGVFHCEEESREEKRRSKGLRDGVGLCCRPEAGDAKALLRGDDWVKP